MKTRRTRMLSLALAFLLCVLPATAFAAEPSLPPPVYFDAASLSLPLDPMPVNAEGKLQGTLPTPARYGFTFAGWFWDGRQVNDSTVFLPEETAPVSLEARWTLEKITPSVTVSPASLKAGEEKVEVKISCATPGVQLDWRPLERVLYGGDGDLSSYIVTNADNVGLKLTGAASGAWNQDMDDDLYPYEYYPEGVYPTSELTLTFEGKSVPGYLIFQLYPGLFVQMAKRGGEITGPLQFSSQDRFEPVTVQIPVEDPDTYTVKFDLNGLEKLDPDYKFFVPEPISVKKGEALKKLPVPEKLPEDQEFYGWGILNSDEKTLTKWDENDPVNGDLTLYLIRNRPEEEKPAEKPTTPTTPTAPTTPDKPSAFTDVTEGRWFKTYVDKVTAAGLMSGMGEGKFEPQANLAVSQALVLAYQIDSKATGRTLPTAEGAWYMPYYRYCLDNGIITAEQVGTSDLTRMATRFEMVSILDKAVPEARMEATKTVDSIPDLQEDAAYGDIVYKWYRAGIVSGDGEGRFNGTNNITRAEVAVILCQINEL